MENKSGNYVRDLVINQEKREYAGKVIFATILYTGITLFLNTIRTTAPLWIVWVLIFIQFALYFLIFIVSYNRAKVCGLKHLGIYLFTILAILGRVNDWEVVIIPLTIMVMLVVSGRSRNISEARKEIFNEQG